MKFRFLSIETSLYLLALGLAAFLRFHHLGAVSLSESEAAWALQALQLSKGAAGMQAVLGPQPAYVLLSGALFAIFSASDFLARFWPALAGTLLVLAPFFVRRWLGRSVALILAFGLALDPGLVAASRIAGGPMLAVGFSLLALALWYARLPAPAGVSAGIALLSGPSLLTGIFALGIAWLILLFLRGRDRELAYPESTATLDEEFSPDSHLPITGDFQPDPSGMDRSRRALLSMAGAVLVAGSLFLLVPQGLAAWLDTLPAYFSGWVQAGGQPAGKLLAGLVVYQPLALAFGLVGVVRGLTTGERFRQVLFLTAWALLALALLLLYPARQVTDLAWVLVPLWALAAFELAHYLPDGEFRIVAVGQAILVFLLLALFWLNLAGIALRVEPEDATQARLNIMLGVLLMIVLTSFLVSFGWSRETGRKGLVWGMTLALGAYLISALWGVTQLRPYQPAELWYPAPAPGQTDLLLETLHTASIHKTGFPDSVEVASTVDTPALRWLLRDFPKAYFLSELTPSEKPPILITRVQADSPVVGAAYRGQDFVFWIYPAWQGALPDDPLAWLVFREAPIEEEKVIVWVRGDLFPGGSEELPSNSSG